MIGTVITLGNNTDVIWEFGGGILGFYVFGAMLSLGVQAIKEFLNQT